MEKIPCVSIVMPVYNAASYLGKAIESILGQSFTNFEFIILDDGSTDHSSEIILSYKDPRMIFIKNEKNTGNYPTRNKGMKLAQGKYIAVMDADDIALSSRLLKEVDYLENHPETGIVSSWVLTSNGYIIKRPDSQDALKALLSKCNCIPHPATMMRKESIDQFNWFYDENYKYAADYELMTRAIFQTKIHIIPEPLLIYRIHNEQISISKRDEQLSYAQKIRQRYISLKRT